MRIEKKNEKDDDLMEEKEVTKRSEERERVQEYKICRKK